MSELARSEYASRLGEVDPVIVRDLGSHEGIDRRAGVATPNIQEPKRLDRLVNQNPVQPGVSLMMNV